MFNLNNSEQNGGCPHYKEHCRNGEKSRSKRLTVTVHHIHSTTVVIIEALGKQGKFQRE